MFCNPFIQGMCFPLHQNGGKYVDNYCRVEIFPFLCAFFYLFTKFKCRLIYKYQNEPI